MSAMYGTWPRLGASAGDADDALAELFFVADFLGVAFVAMACEVTIGETLTAASVGAWAAWADTYNAQWVRQQALRLVRREWKAISADGEAWRRVPLFVLLAVAY